MQVTLRQYLANKAVTILGESYNRWCGTSTLGVGDDSGLTTLHSSNCRVGCSKVDAHNLQPKIILNHSKCEADNAA
jgi:hypothetical protein